MGVRSKRGQREGLEYEDKKTERKMRKKKRKKDLSDVLLFYLCFMQYVNDVLHIFISSLLPCPCSPLKLFPLNSTHDVEFQTRD